MRSRRPVVCQNVRQQGIPFHHYAVFFRCRSIGLAVIDQMRVNRCFNQTKGRCEMLEAIAIILIILWLLGLVSSYTMGGLIHILLVIAIVVIVIRLLQGRRVL